MITKVFKCKNCRREFIKTQTLRKYCSSTCFTESSKKAAKKNRRKKSNTPIKNRCDTLFAKLVRERDSRCLRCGKIENLQCNHIISRRELRFRWTFNNAYTLCAGCHLYWWHDQKYPDQNISFLKERLPGFYEAYLANKNIALLNAQALFKPDWDNLPNIILLEHTNLKQLPSSLSDDMNLKNIDL